MSNNDAEYIPVETAAEILKITTRHVNRFGNEGKIRTRKAGRRILYLREDVQALAEELGVDLVPVPRPLKADLVPAGEMLEYIRERDRNLEEMQRQLIAIANQNGRLQEQAATAKLLMDDNQSLRERIAVLEAELAQANHPWYKKLFGHS